MFIAWCGVVQSGPSRLSLSSDHGGDTTRESTRETRSVFDVRVGGDGGGKVSKIGDGML